MTDAAASEALMCGVGEGGGRGAPSKNNIERVQTLYFISFYGINASLRILPSGRGEVISTSRLYLSKYTWVGSVCLG